MNRKIILLAIGVMAAFALAACSSGGAASSAASSSASSSESASSSAAAVSSASASSANVAAVDKRRVYVTPEWVKSVIDGKQAGYEDFIIGEVVYGEKADPTADGYVPGAIRIYDVDVEDAEGTVEAPYNLLDPKEIESNLLAHGITKDTKLILYGEDPAGVGRVAYACLYMGVDDVKILNGGIKAWKSAGFDTESKLADGKAATSFGTPVPAHPEYWVSMEDAKKRLESDSNFKLVSIRSEDEWLGKTSGYDYINRAGEPEGAVWGKGAKTAFDVADFVESDGKVKELDGLMKVWEGCDFTLDNHLCFYCGTGWRATVPFLVLYQEGNDNVSMYDGGWYEWQLHDENPVQVGDPASADCQHTTVAELPTDKAAPPAK